MIRMTSVLQISTYGEREMIYVLSYQNKEETTHIKCFRLFNISIELRWMKKEIFLFSFERKNLNKRYFSLLFLN